MTDVPELPGTEGAGDRCPLVGPADLVWLRPVLPGEPARIVAALRDARQWAIRLRAELYRLGVITQDGQIQPGVNDDGEPIVRVTLTVAGARRLHAAMFGPTAPPSGSRTAGDEPERPSGGSHAA